MLKRAFIVGMLLTVGACEARTDRSLWRVTEGKGCVTEFKSEHRAFCGPRCYSFVVGGRPEEVFVSPFGEDTLKGLRDGTRLVSRSYDVHVLDLRTNTLSKLPLERFLELDIVFEELPVWWRNKQPELEYGGNSEGFEYEASIQRNGAEFIATLSSEKKTTEKTTFGIPGVIPFFGREKWFQKEASHSGTLFLEVFRKENPAKPVVQLQKNFTDLWLLPSIFEMSAWTQGSEEPLLVVVDNESVTETKRGRVLLIRADCQGGQSLPEETKR